jgi:Leucine-rich repeat (LRR) protein
VSDLKPLSGLHKLTRLRLTWNAGVTDLSALDALPALEVLELTGTNASILPTLSKATRLRRVELSGNESPASIAAMVAAHKGMSCDGTLCEVPFQMQ